MKRLVFLCLLSVARPGYGEAPVAVESIVSAEDLVAEIQYQVGQLKEYTADEESYAKAQEKKRVAQAAGTLACIAQALVEHDDAPDGIAAAALRDAALSLRRPDSLETTRKALAQLDSAVAGKGEGAAEYDWAKLINMHRMMEEMSSRHSQIRRLLRRPKDPAADSRHASTQAILGLALIADTHEVKNKDDLPQWNEWATGYQSTMTGLAKAIRSGDKDEAKALYTKGAKSCSACHEKFRK